MQTSHIPVAVAYGDGIGPEIMEAVVNILSYTLAPVRIETIEVGEKYYQRQYPSGIPHEAWDIIKRTKALLKAPITTPQGKGYKSLNVTLRRALGLYANVRPCKSYPFVSTSSNLDVVVVRENEEDLYAGIEYRQSQNVFQCLKLTSRSASERIVKYAFDYAVRNNRKKVTCFSKDNIMKMTDGVFHKVFDEIAAHYPSIEAEHYIIDIGTARLAAKPELFDVVVTGNLYGDIISDVAAEISGSVGMAGSANIGQDYAMFEAVHGSAPDIAGQNIANPSGLLHAMIMMLVHIGLPQTATTIHNAWLATMEAGYHTADIFNPKTSAHKVGTKEFADAVIKHLGQTPKTLPVVSYDESDNKTEEAPKIQCDIPQEEKKLVGVDVFVDWKKGSAVELAEEIHALSKAKLKLQFIDVKGLKVYPGEFPHNPQNDHWRLRFVGEGNDKTISHQDILELLGYFKDAELDFIKIENLYLFGDALGFTLSQGE